MSWTLKVSAVRKREETSSISRVISARRVWGSGWASSSARKAASIPPCGGSEPQSPDGHAQLRTARWRLTMPAPPTPYTRRRMISACGIRD